MTPSVDHLVLCVTDLDEAAAALTDRGLASLPGGRHSGHGTANRIVPLGDTYLELVGVVDPDEAQTSPFGVWVGARASLPLTVDAICLRTDDLDAVCERLDLDAVSMSRVRPDGTTLAWRLAGLEVALRDGVPFFIEWEVPDSELPARADVAHPAGIVRLEEVVLRGDLEKLRKWTGSARGVRLVEGETRDIAARLSTGEALPVTSAMFGARQARL